MSHKKAQTEIRNGLLKGNGLDLAIVIFFYSMPLDAFRG
jgi:hypothetical protein